MGELQRAGCDDSDGGAHQGEADEEGCQRLELSVPVVVGGVLGPGSDPDEGQDDEVCGEV